MKVNLQKYLLKRPNIIEWAIIHLVSRKEFSNIPEFMPKGQGGTCDTENMDIELKINGVEVDFIELMERIDKENDLMVAKKAKELVEERCDGFFEKIEEMKSAFDELISKETEKFRK